MWYFGSMPDPKPLREHLYSVHEDEFFVQILVVRKHGSHWCNEETSDCWEKTHGFYNEHLHTIYTTCTKASILHRWEYIQDSVNKFVICYDQVQHVCIARFSFVVWFTFIVLCEWFLFVRRARLVYCIINLRDSSMLAHCWSILKAGIIRSRKWQRKLEIMWW